MKGKPYIVGFQETKLRINTTKGEIYLGTEVCSVYDALAGLGQTFIAHRGTKGVLYANGNLITLPSAIAFEISHNADIPFSEAQQRALVIYAVSQQRTIIQGREYGKGGEMDPYWIGPTGLEGPENVDPNVLLCLGPMKGVPQRCATKLDKTELFKDKYFVTDGALYGIVANGKTHT